MINCKEFWGGSSALKRVRAGFVVAIDGPLEEHIARVFRLGGEKVGHQRS